MITNIKGLQGNDARGRSDKSRRPRMVKEITGAALLLVKFDGDHISTYLISAVTSPGAQYISSRKNGTPKK